MIQRIWAVNFLHPLRNGNQERFSVPVKYKNQPQLKRY